MTLGASKVDVEAGRILAWPSFADVFACCRIPGRSFDAAHKAWSFPATSAAAAALAKALRRLHTTPAFDSLAASGNQQKVTAPVAPPVAQVPPEPPPALVAEPEVALPAGLQTRPWRHQVAALRFCLQCFAAGRHGILLALIMGGGKSLVSMMLMLWLKAQRTMIACPLRVVPVWVGQIERHVDARMIVIALDDDAGSVAQKMELAAAKMKLAETLGVPFVCIVNYDSAWREPFAAWAEKQRWDLVIADESHRLKAASGKASLFFKRLRPHAAYRIGLTGTPLPHGPMDIYAQFRFLDVTIFGPSFSAFRTKYAVMGGYHNKQITGFQRLDELERLMSRITFRVGSEVLDLPPATHVTYHCDLCPEARRVYKDLEEDFVAEVRDGVVTAANALVKLTRLQHVANGVVKTDNGIEHRIDDAKRKLLADMFLAACSYMLRPIIAVLRMHGIPFHNPYRRSNGFRNPLRLGKPSSTPNRILALLIGHPDFGEGHRAWVHGDLAAWAELIQAKGVLRHGVKSKLKAGDVARPVTMEHLAAMFEPDALDSMMAAWDAGSRALLEWWRGRLTEDARKRVEFPAEIVANGGPRALLETPQVVVGTIHSVKGGEADVVVLFPDLSPAGDAQCTHGGVLRDTVIRQFYVAATRARERLYICGRASSLAIPI